MEASLEYVRPFAVSSGRPPFCGVLAVGTVSCDPHVHSPFVHGAGSDRGEGRRSGGGWSTGTSSTVRSSPLLFSEGREVKPPASQPREKRSVN